jgi:hypothetical protein
MIQIRIPVGWSTKKLARQERTESLGAHGVFRRPVELIVGVDLTPKGPYP